MNINRVNNINFGFKLSPVIKENLDNQRRNLSKKYGEYSQSCINFDRKRYLIEKYEPNLSLDAEEDNLINYDALLITVYDKNNDLIYENNNNYKKYGSEINIDSIFEFVVKYIKEKNMFNKN